MIKWQIFIPNINKYNNNITFNGRQKNYISDAERHGNLI